MNWLLFSVLMLVGEGISLVYAVNLYFDETIKELR